MRQLCRLAPEQLGRHTLTAATSTGNVASQRVLIKSGFTETGPADPAEVGGKPGIRYQRDLSADD